MIDIILTTHNRPQKVLRMLDCIRNQSTQDYRLIVVNDGGSEQYDADVNISIQPNQGVHIARNRGLAAGDSPLVMFVDDDDQMSETFVEEMVAAADGREGNYFYSRAYRLFAGGWWNYSDWEGRKVDWIRREYNQACALIPFPGAVFRRSVFGPDPFRFWVCGDWEWKIRNYGRLWPVGVETKGYYMLDLTGDDRLSIAPGRAETHEKAKALLAKITGGK